MIDGSIDQDFAAFERQESFRGVAASAPDAGGASADRIHFGRLAERFGQAARQQTEEAVEVAPSPEAAESSDPLGHLHAARLGFAAVVILVIYWLWIRSRRA